MKNNEQLKAVREAQKRLAWIENVKRIKGLSQEEAERLWLKIDQSQCTAPVE